MTLQQLRYVDTIASCGTISEAARKVFITQPSLTEAIQTLEEELRFAIFNRSRHGMTLTREGEEFLASARQILSDVDHIQAKYTGKAVRLPQFAVSCQHFAFAVEAFMDVVKEFQGDSYDYTLRETATSEIIDDVSSHKSEIGVLYLSKRNERSLGQIFNKEELDFAELFVAHPHVFIGKNHPLAGKRKIKVDALDDYPFISFEQGEANALYFSEEVMPSIERKKNIRVRDRATMTNLILGLNGFTIASGALSKQLNGPDLVSIPLEYDDLIRVGLLTRKYNPISRQGQRFIESIKLHAVGGK